MKQSKYIALVDCDSFFCSCERTVNPELNNKPICVVSNARGCIISRSKEAKKAGVKMGEPLFMAEKEHPECTYIIANHKLYLEISKKVMSVLKDFSPNVEVYSIDEAFVDFTGLTKLYKRNYYKLAQYLQEKIYNTSGIPVSIGISRSKTLAKLASDRAKDKDNRILLIGKNKINKYLKNVDVSEVWGIGRRLALRFRKFGVIYIGELLKMNDEILRKNFGINGITTKHELCGKYVIPLNNRSQVPKSISDTQSFPEFTSDYGYLRQELMSHIHKTCSKLRKINLKCKKIGLIVKTKDFRFYWRENILSNPTAFELDISKAAFELLDEIYKPDVLYRSIGIVLDDFSSTDEEQLSLLNDNENKIKKENLGKAIDNIESKFGVNSVRIGFTNDNALNKQDFITVPKNTY